VVITRFDKPPFLAQVVDILPIARMIPRLQLRGSLLHSGYGLVYPLQ
jgi:hypothetical protein